MQAAKRSRAASMDARSLGSGDCTEVFYKTNLELKKCESILSQKPNPIKYAGGDPSGSLELYVFAFKILATATGLFLALFLKSSRILHPWISSYILLILKNLNGSPENFKGPSNSLLSNFAQCLKLIFLVFLYAVSLAFLLITKLLLLNLPNFFWK